MLAEVPAYPELQFDVPDRLDDQLTWLDDAGFEATPFWVYKDLAVVRAIRPRP